MESGDKKPLLQEEDNSKPKDLTQQQSDVKDAAFWLFMLFLASVTMTVGNKVRRRRRRRFRHVPVRSLVFRNVLGSGPRLFFFSDAFDKC